MAPLKEQDSQPAEMNSAAEDAFSEPSSAASHDTGSTSELCQPADVDSLKALPIQAVASRKMPLQDTPPWKGGHRRSTSAFVPAKVPDVQSYRRRASSLSDSYKASPVTHTPVQQVERSPGEVMQIL